jgi:hypothetical protein
MGTFTMESDDKSYTYTELSFCDTYLFIPYCYHYQERFKFEKNRIKHLEITIEDEGKKRSITATQQGDTLYYANGVKVDLRHIERMPFEAFPESLKATTSFVTFVPESGNIVREIYHMKGHTEFNGRHCMVVEKENTNSNEWTTYTVTKSGEVLRFKTERFHASPVSNQYSIKE